MKLLPAALVSLLLVCAAAGEEKKSSLVPQPRLQLDPNSHTPVRVTVREEKKDASPSIILMDKFVVKGQSVGPTEPRKNEDPEGKFSLFGGGRMLERDIGKLRLELGLWPSFDIMWKDSRFKSEKTRVDVDFLRIKW